MRDHEPAREHYKFTTTNMYEEIWSRPSGLGGFEQPIINEQEQRLQLCRTYVNHLFDSFDEIKQITEDLEEATSELIDAFRPERRF
jgi:hypothetical protein